MAKIKSKACQLSKKRIRQLEAQKRGSGTFMKTILDGRIKIQKRFQIRACGKKV